jgi:hypothetical protein
MKTSVESSISCLLFTCPLIEENHQCKFSNFGKLTLNQKPVFYEKPEKIVQHQMLHPKFLCLIRNENE